MNDQKPMTLADARERAETIAKVAEGRLNTWPRNIEASQWRVDSQMFRLLLAAGTDGPTTSNVSTGAGDVDIVCDGCGEVVTAPHSWADCCAAQKAMIVSLREKMLQADASNWHKAAANGDDLANCTNCGDFRAVTMVGEDGEKTLCGPCRADHARELGRQE